tara:strand:+ start:164 stop:1129 length:966 start_codon:yes stop_codon:yes gene_type:complete
MKFAAIDFELANRKHESPCAVGVAIYNNNELMETFSLLIKPHRLYNDFLTSNVEIHGITKSDVVDAPEFPIVWSKLEQIIEFDFLLAHNAPFDFSVLRKTLGLYGIKFPLVNYCCTREVAKKTWPELINYKLPTIADYLSIELEHHQAESDAKACGDIFIKAIGMSNYDDADNFLEELGLKFAHIYPDGTYDGRLTKNPRGNYYRQEKLNVQSIQSSTEHFDEAHVFFGKSFCFTGTLKRLSRKEAMQLVVDVGGDLGNSKAGSVTKKTNYLVVGNQDIRVMREGHKQSKKYDKAVRLKQGGADIELLSEDEFIEMLGDIF